MLASLCMKKMPKNGSCTSRKTPGKQLASVGTLHPAVRSVLDPGFLASPVNWDVGASTRKDRGICILLRSTHSGGNLSKTVLGARTGTCLVTHLSADRSNDASEFGLVLTGMAVSCSPGNKWVV